MSSYDVLCVRISTTMTKYVWNPIPREEIDKICPQPDFVASDFIDHHIVEANKLEEDERAHYLTENFIKLRFALNSEQLKKILTTVKMGQGLKEFLAMLDAKIFRLFPQDLVEILHFYGAAEKQIILEELKDTLSDTSDETIAAIAAEFKCKSVPVKIMEKVKPRNCVLGRKLKNVVIVIDKSGSMRKKFKVNEETEYTRIDYTKAIMHEYIEDMPEGGKFNIVIFSSAVNDPWRPELVESTPQNRAAAIEYINEINPIGGTNIDGAVEKSLSFAEPDYNIIFNTDGYPTKGEKKKDKIIENLKKLNAKRETDGKKPCVIDVNLMMLGPGESEKQRTSANEIAHAIAEEGNGIIKDLKI